MRQPKLALALALGLALAAGGCKEPRGRVPAGAHPSQGPKRHASKADLPPQAAADEAGKDREDEAGRSAHEEHRIELSPEASARIIIRTTKVEERPLAGVLSTTGRVDFNQDRLAHVAPRVRGRVHSVRATLGDEVGVGQILAVVDSIELGRAKSDYVRAKVQLDLARRTLERERALLADRITSEQAVLEAESAEQRALADYRAARQELRLLGLSDRQIASTSADDRSAALMPLRSPLQGTIVEKHVSLGEMVSPDRSLFTVADLSQVWIWIDLYERDLARVHLEDDVSVIVDALPKQPFEGEVAYIGDQIDPNTRRARARIDVPNRSRELRPGMFGRVTVTDPHGVAGSKAPPTLIVPTSAVQRDADEEVAFVKVGESLYERRELAIGRRTDAWVEVTRGLSAGESVVVEGTFLLKSEAAKANMGGGHHH